MVARTAAAAVVTRGVTRRRVRHVQELAQDALRARVAGRHAPAGVGVVLGPRALAAAAAAAGLGQRDA